MAGSIKSFLMRFLVLLLPLVASSPVHQAVFGGNVEAYINATTQVPLVIEQALNSHAQIQHVHVNVDAIVKGIEAHQPSRPWTPQDASGVLIRYLSSLQPHLIHEPATTQMLKDYKGKHYERLRRHLTALKPSELASVQFLFSHMNPNTTNTTLTATLLFDSDDKQLVDVTAYMMQHVS
jgi:hypothetical protein